MPRLNSLSAKQKIVLQLYVEGFDTLEIAAQTGVNRSSINAMLVCIRDFMCAANTPNMIYKAGKAGYLA